MKDALEPPDGQPAVVRRAAGSGARQPRRDGAVVRSDRTDLEFSAFYRTEVRALYRSWPEVIHPRAWSRRVASRKYGR